MSSRKPFGSDSDERADVGTTLRRRPLGAPTTRRLLFTVMGEFLLSPGAAAWTSTFIDVLGRLDVEPGTVRQTLVRVATEGWVSSERVGRRTRWGLTPSGEQALVEGEARVHQFAGATVDWDGRWLIALASVPESDRAGRHFLRSRLSRVGLGSPAPGVWLGPDPARLAEVEEILSGAGIAEAAQVFAAEHLGSSSIRAMIQAAWDLASIDEEYEHFIAEFSSVETDDPLTRVVELAYAWGRFPWRDPALPRELLPADWRGPAAAALFHDRHARWTKAAWREWQTVNGDSNVMSGPAG